MIIHNYDRDTGRFVNSNEADLCPVTGRDWLIPANATDVCPPDYDPRNEDLYWQSDQWVVKAKPISLPPQPRTKFFALVKNSRVLMTLETEGSLSWNLMDGCFWIEDTSRSARAGGIFDGTSFGASDGLDFA